MVANEDEKKTTVSITTLGDDSCEHCVDEKKKFTEKVKGPNASYEYIDAHSDKGQKLLEEMGVKEGEHVDVPITRVQKCEIVKDETGAEQKKCSTEKDWKDSWMDAIEKGEIPEDL